MRFENDFGSFTVATTGASLLQLSIGGKEVLHDFGADWTPWAAGAVMFPFPVRMSSGTLLQFEQQEYQWPINDKKHRAALHGLTPWEEFELEELVDGIQAQWSYSGSKDYYPFPCRLTLTYTLGREALHLSCKVENHGPNPMPYHMGWHPYFRLTSTPSLEKQPTQRLKKNEYSHPGEKIPCEEFDWSQEVDGAYFMDHIVVDGSVEIQPLSAVTQVFRPKGAPFVAVEPITGLGHPEFPWRVVPSKGEDQVKTVIRVVK